MNAHSNRSEILVLGFPDYEQQAYDLAKALDAPVSIVDLHRFPDGESLVKIPTPLPPRVVLFRSLDNPNSKLVELLLCSATARTLGAKHITLVAPYLCYMRQDKAFHPGEAVSQQIVGQFIGNLCDSLITVDPHLHRIHQLSEAVSVYPALVLSAAALFSNFLTERLSNPFLIGPDSESRQWVAKVAQPAQLDYAVGAKTRRGDREVSIEFPITDFSGRTVVIMDDIASTGNTLATAARKVVAAGASAVYGLVTHALFAGNATTLLQQAGIQEMWSTDSIPHPTNAVSLVSMLKESVERIFTNQFEQR